VAVVTLPIHGGGVQATFVVAIKDLDLSRLQPFLARNWAGERGGFPLGNLAQLLSGVALRVVWTIPGGSQPQVSYHMPEPLEALLGGFHQANDDGFHCLFFKRASHTK
jgi:hypothetical protein